MKKESSFNLQKFRKAYRVVEKLQDEFVELVKSEVLKIPAFGGCIVVEKTDTAHVQIIRHPFICQIEVSDIPVTLKLYLTPLAHYQDSNVYKLEKMFLTCDELSICDYCIIGIEHLKEFHIFYTTEENKVQVDTVII